MIYIIKQAGLYQNKVNSSLISNCNCKMGYSCLAFSFCHFSKTTLLQLGVFYFLLGDIDFPAFL